MFYFSKWKKKKKLMKALHKRIADNYSKYFMKLSKPADELLDCLSLLIGIQIFWIFDLVFRNDKASFGLRFLYDCIHFVL